MGVKCGAIGITKKEADKTISRVCFLKILMLFQVTDFHLDQHYGTAGPLGDFDYVGYYDYATCWNTTNTAK